MISAGRVLLMPKGDYDPTATYGLLDIVSYNGSSYIAKGTTTGNLPTNTTYWQLSAYGGSAANMAANFASVETSEYATQAYSQGDYLVDKDGQFCLVTSSIAIGDEINATNTESTSVEKEIGVLSSYIESLDSEDIKLTGKTVIAVQTDLHTLGIGNYYKTNTSVYVTNAPTGIDSVPTATFRLTVENTTNVVGDTNKILTLRTFDGKTYTQAYDGTTWSAWKLFGDIADVPTYTGATSVAPGVKGLVPAAAAAEKDNYLKGDGTWGALGTAAAKDATDTIASGSNDLITSGAVYTANQTLTNQIAKAYKSDDSAETTIDGADYIPFYDSSASAMKKILVSNAKFGGGALYYSGRACSATTGNFCTVSSADITANHVVAECTFSKPSAITTDVTWTTSSGSLVLNGTCTDATCTANITLVEKSN